jgi:hypothetical protein
MMSVLVLALSFMEELQMVGLIGPLKQVTVVMEVRKPCA